MSDSQNKVSLTMVFDNQKSLDKFVQFLDRFGEQAYWEWMEGADPNKRNTVSFNYWPDGIAEGKHHAGNTILCPNKE
jgi:hypothetical protein